MEFDALLLSRIQFAFTIAFHIIFPAFTIGLASWLVALEFNWLRTGNPLYRNLFRFWVKIFAVSFGLGVVSGIVMSYQFGTNWSRFSEFAGNVLGPLIAYEVITAFFLEAAFLGIMLFGWERVGDRLHFFATCMVALGTLLSRLLDPVRQFLDADAGRLRHRERHRRAGRLVARSSSTRPSRCATPTWCWAAISRRPSRSPACRPG